MPSPQPMELLVACRSCGIENSIPDYTPGFFAACGQCRERLIDMELMDSHKELVCGDCGMTLLLLKDTEVKPGGSTCKCGGSNLALQASPSIPRLAEEAGSSKKAGASLVEDDFDWCRPASNEEASEDYNDIFDNDPGF